MFVGFKLAPLPQVILLFEALVKSSPPSILPVIATVDVGVPSLLLLVESYRVPVPPSLICQTPLKLVPQTLAPGVEFTSPTKAILSSA